MPRGKHPETCPCAWCALLVEQAKGAKTTKENRFGIVLHITKDEREQLRELAAELSTSPKALAESAVRSVLNQ